MPAGAGNAASVGTVPGGSSTGRSCACTAAATGARVAMRSASRGAESAATSSGGVGKSLPVDGKASPLGGGAVSNARHSANGVAPSALRVARDP